MSGIIFSWNIQYKNGWKKYDHRVKNKKYTTPCPIYGMWGGRKTSWDGSANKKNNVLQPNETK